MADSKPIGRCTMTKSDRAVHKQLRHLICMSSHAHLKTAARSWGPIPNLPSKLLEDDNLKFPPDSNFDDVAIGSVFATCILTLEAVADSKPIGRCTMTKSDGAVHKQLRHLICIYI